MVNKNKQSKLEKCRLLFSRCTIGGTVPVNQSRTARKVVRTVTKSYKEDDKDYFHEYDMSFVWRET